MRYLQSVKGALVCLLALSILVTVGCGGGSDDSDGTSASSAAGDAPTGGRLIWAKPEDAVSLDPPLSSAAASWQILSLSYETLVGVDEDLKPTPQLAASWEQTSPTTYVFEIRRGVKFSNGREMTVEDVVGSLKRLINPKTGSFWPAQLGEVRSVTSPGPWQVEIEIGSPRPSFIPALANVMAAVTPIKELRSGDFDPAKEMLGTGPFMAVDHKQDESWTFDRNPHYWQEGQPKADRLAVRIMPEDAARVAGLRDGSVDIATFETPDATQLLDGQSDVETVVQDTTDSYYLNINAKSSVFRDATLRQAASLVLDREAIRNLALGEVGTPAGPVAPGFDEGCDPESLPYGVPDVEQASQLVEDAGAAGRKVSIMAWPGVYPQIAQVVQEALEQTGLDVRIEQLELPQWVERSGAGDFDLSIGWVAGYSDPAMALAWWNPEFAGFNAAWLPFDEKLVGLVNESLRGGPDRTEAIQATCEGIAEQAVMVPLVTKPSIVGYRTDRVIAAIRGLEGYGVPLRGIGEFAVNR